LVQEALELYRDLKIGPKRTSVLDISTFSVGKISKPLGPDDELLGEMLEGTVK